MRVAIMQPYFFPYIGYFQLISAVDIFIVYDNIKYTKRGWINRNRILQNGRDVMLTLPLKSDSDTLDICKREVAADFNRVKFLNQLSGAYRGAPYFTETLQLVEQIVSFKDENLFRFLHNSIVKTCAYLGISTEIIISSEIDIDHSLKSQEKVLALCDYVGAKTYINAIGGIELYSKYMFRLRGVDLKFIQSKPFEYQQFGSVFVPWLSIIDVLMFNSTDIIKECLNVKYDLIEVS
ncbi:WbqC family protein [Methylomonas sp. OY6]|uniref:WbqC family protein n=2 Tax=Methylomonas TaxID=416 RepID=A0ABU4UGZ1_9GAMM|nr:WbqC family protein [Methylomonas sp. OY6]MDX8128383.1 WbqC family protein [Methylomonas sp. OY6]